YQCGSGPVCAMLRRARIASVKRLKKSKIPRFFRAYISVARDRIELPTQACQPFRRAGAGWDFQSPATP
ncbi:MAG: hypothetical protein L6422_09065, partial [Candidatus Marinimicrobia bacterium]|nr:hypothetical protein [Candidatus Neomarinimicrobiota bacterium]